MAPRILEIAPLWRDFSVLSEMNLPPPGSPDFDKLINGQPKKDWTKEPVIHVPKSKKHSIQKLKQLIEHDALAFPDFDPLKPLLLGVVPPWTGGLPPLMPALYELQQLQAIQGQLYDSLQKGLDAAMYGQLDCTDLEAQRTARTLDWDARDRMLDALNRKCSR